MINANPKRIEAIVCCDGCLIELSRGPYPSDAEDNLSSEHWIISGDGEKPNEHYCNTCYHDLEIEKQLK